MTPAQIGALVTAALGVALIFVSTGASTNFPEPAWASFVGMGGLCLCTGGVGIGLVAMGVPWIAILIPVLILGVVVGLTLLGRWLGRGRHE